MKEKQVTVDLPNLTPVYSFTDYLNKPSVVKSTRFGILQLVSLKLHREIRMAGKNRELCNVLHLLCNAKDIIEFIFEFQPKISFI